MGDAAYTLIALGAAKFFKHKFNRRPDTSVDAYEYFIEMEEWIIDWLDEGEYILVTQMTSEKKFMEDVWDTYLKLK